MAVTITVAELSAAIRLGTTAAETAEATRLLAYSTTAVEKHAPGAPSNVQNEAVIRLAGYLYDSPTAARGASFANVLRNSGAAAILLPYRIHRAGSTADAVAEAQAAVGTVGNPVTGVSIASSTLTITFADGSTTDLALPSGGGSGSAGVDQVARNAAAAAQATADRKLDSPLTDGDIPSSIARDTEVESAIFREIADYPSRLEIEQILRSLGIVDDPTTTELDDQDNIAAQAKSKTTTTIDLSAGTYLVEWIGTPSINDRVQVRLVKDDDESELVDFGILHAGKNAPNTSTRLLVLSDDTTAAIEYANTGSAGDSNADVDDASLRVASLAATSDVDQTAIEENTAHINGLTHLTRDIHDNNKPTWTLASNAGLAFATATTAPGGHTYKNELIRGTDSYPTVPVYVLARIPHGAEVNHFRVRWTADTGQFLVGSGNIWQVISVNDATYDYYATRLRTTDSLIEAIGVAVAKIDIETDATLGETVWKGRVGEDSVDTDAIEVGAVTLERLESQVQARLLPSSGLSNADGKFLARTGGSSGKWVLVNAPAATLTSTYTKIGNAATVSGTRHLFTFDNATATAFRTAWNGGTYREFLIELTWGTRQQSSVRLPVRPTTLDDNRYQWYLPIHGGDSDGTAEDFSMDFRGNLDPDQLVANALLDNTFPSSSSLTIYGVN